MSSLLRRKGPEWYLTLMGAGKAWPPLDHWTPPEVLSLSGGCMSSWCERVAVSHPAESNSLASVESAGTQLGGLHLCFVLPVQGHFSPRCHVMAHEKHHTVIC